MKNEDSRYLRRLYKGRNFVLKFQDNLTMKKTPQQENNTGKTGKYCTKAHDAQQEARGSLKWHTKAPGACLEAQGAFVLELFFQKYGSTGFLFGHVVVLEFIQTGMHFSKAFRHL